MWERMGGFQISKYCNSWKLREMCMEVLKANLIELTTGISASQQRRDGRRKDIINSLLKHIFFNSFPILRGFETVRTENSTYTPHLGVLTE